MAPRDKVDDGISTSESSPDDQPKPSAELTAPSEPTKKKTPIVDTTMEHQGMSIAIIGGFCGSRD
jgi:hypothetical protein